MPYRSNYLEFLRNIMMSAAAVSDPDWGEDDPIPAERKNNEDFSD